MNLDPGTVLEGRFRIDRAISSGGMGEVYRAFDLQQGIAVALKRMLLELAESERDLIIRKFEEEVQVLRRLEYPGIPRFVADFLLEGNRCIVMEFIQGTDLESEVRERASFLHERGLPPAQAVATVIQICRIVEYLHALRPHPIIHRDIKPANVIRRVEDGRIYLVDFGLARNVRESEAKQTKTMVGTVGYAPLEQFQGKPEQRSDEYSIAVTLHFLLTAESPIPFQIPNLDKVLPNIHPELSQIVRTATLNEMDLRYPSVYDLRRELERVLPELPDTMQVASEPVGDGRVTQAVPDLSEGNTQRADWEQLLSRGAQRQLLEGIHQEARDPNLDSFGTSDPLANQNHAEFNRAALEVLKQPEYEAESPRPVLSRLVPWFLLLAGTLALTGTYQLVATLLRPAWAQAMLDPTQRDQWRVRELRGVFESNDGAGLGLTHALPLGLLEKLWRPPQAGVVFERDQPLPVSQLKFEVVSWKGPVEALVFVQDRGVLLTSHGSALMLQRVILGGAALGHFGVEKYAGEAMRLPKPTQIMLGAAASAQRLGAVLRNPDRGGELIIRGLKPL